MKATEICFDFHLQFGFTIILSPQVEGCHTLTVSRNGKHASVGWMPSEQDLRDVLPEARNAWCDFHSKGILKE